MGTRSVIKFYELVNNERIFYCAIYQQFDGYIEGVGEELKEFIKSSKLVNGFSECNTKEFNGIGCLIAQFIKRFKQGVGGLYITTEVDYQEYNYYVVVDSANNKISVNCEEESSYSEVIK